MTDDLLRRASSALREETADATDGARFTRARVMASLQQSQVRRRSRLAVLLPLAACFAAASAFGMVDGRVPALVRSVTQSLGFGNVPSEAPAAPARKKPIQGRPAASPTASSVAAPLEPMPEPATELAPAEPASSTPKASTTTAAPAAPKAPRNAGLAMSAQSSVAPHVEPERSASEPANPALGDVSDRAHELYRVAHRSHFVDHDFVAALRAWDAYLEAAPNGRFVLEARYNRALCLIRVGRRNEARDALTPFANGQFGSYRQGEARALIDATGE
jgi:hypothetical protein